MDRALPAIIRRPRSPVSSFSGLMVILRELDPSHKLLSVRAVIRSFSSASLAFEISSRRKISLMAQVGFLVYQRMLIEGLTDESKD